MEVNAYSFYTSDGDTVYVDTDKTDYNAGENLVVSASFDCIYGYCPGQQFVEAYTDEQGNQTIVSTYGGYYPSGSVSFTTNSTGGHYIYAHIQSNYSSDYPSIYYNTVSSYTPPPTVSCSVNNNPVPSGISPAITIYTSNAGECYVDNDWNRIYTGYQNYGTFYPGVQAAGSHNGEVYCFNLDHTQGDGWYSCPYTVTAGTPPPVPIVEVFATGLHPLTAALKALTIPYKGDVDISWKPFPGATSCTCTYNGTTGDCGSGVGTGLVYASHNPYILDATTTFNVTCSDSVLPCTKDAQICPDGSSVGRISPPTCNFAACPQVVISGTLHINSNGSSGSLVGTNPLNNSGAPSGAGGKLILKINGTTVCDTSDPDYPPGVGGMGYNIGDCGSGNYNLKGGDVVDITAVGYQNYYSANYKLDLLQFTNGGQVIYNFDGSTSSTTSKNYSYTITQSGNYGLGVTFRP